MDKLPAHFTVAGLAKHWAVSIRTITRRIDSGQLPGAWRDPSGWRIPRAAVLDFERRHRPEDLEVAA